MTAPATKTPTAWKTDDELFALARGEKTVLNAIQEGMGAREAFETYGIM